MSAKDVYVLVAGNIGTGKTSLAEALATALGGQSLPERVEDNPFFERFYEAPETWAFRSQVAFAAEALRGQVAAQAAPSVVQDRSIYEGVDVFAHVLREEGHLSEEEFAALLQLKACGSCLCRQPSLLIYLHAPAPALMRRIRHRDRPAERRIEAEYLEQLDARYRDFVDKWGTSEVIAIDSARTDLRKPEVIEELSKQVLAST